MFLIDVHKGSSVSAPKLRCPSSARLATFPARLGSAREISARTHHYYISLYQMQFNDKKGSLVANDEGKKILIRRTVHKSWNSILREYCDFSFQSFACKSKCIYTKNKSFRLNKIAKCPLGPQFPEHFLQCLIYI